MVWLYQLKKEWKNKGLGEKTDKNRGLSQNGK